MSPPATKPRPAVEFDVASLAVHIAQLEGSHALLESQVNSSIQTMTGSIQAMQSDVQRIGERSVDNNALLHELKERSTGLERLSLAVETTGRGHAGDTNKVSLELAGMKGFIRGVVLCGAIGFGSLGMFVVYRMDKTDDALNRLHEIVQMYHPSGATR